MLFKYARLLGFIVLGIFAIICIGMVLICLGCTPEKVKDLPIAQQGEGNNAESKNTATTQDQNALKINNTADNSRTETKIDNRINFMPIPPVQIPDEPELPEFPAVFLSLADAIPSAKCKDDSCSLPPLVPIVNAPPPSNPPGTLATKIDLNPMLMEMHQRDLKTLEKNYSARLSATEAAARAQVDVTQKQAEIAKQMAESRIQEMEREIAAKAKAKEMEIRATEEKWRILTWLLGACGLVALLIRSPLDRWRERKQKAAENKTE